MRKKLTAEQQAIRQEEITHLHLMTVYFTVVIC